MTLRCCAQRLLIAALALVASGGAPLAEEYSAVVTADTVSMPGVFTVHRRGAQVLFEIPRAEFGKPFLWLATVSATQGGFGYGGAQTLREHVIWFEPHEGRVLVRQHTARSRARPGTPEARAVAASSLPSIVAALDIVAVGDNGAVLIDAAPLLTGTASAIRRVRGAGSIDPARTWVERVAAYPQNVEVTVVATMSVSGRQGFAGTHATAKIHNSLLRLPERPMRPRIADPRIGAYTTPELREYGTDAHVSRPARYIKRFRLEKKDPDASISEPVKPIVFYIDRGVPDKWRPYIKRGVEAWLPAFEQAGFRNAIIAREAPAPDEDPGWNPDDARYSVIRWLPSTERNALGLAVADPRTGEVLRANVLLYNDALANLRNWYFTMASAADPRARELPFSDELMGSLMIRLVAHEVGHTLSLLHNRLGGSAYPVESYRDPDFVSEYGLTASIMDFARANYIAQPGDGVETMLLDVGPYDRFAIEWMYSEFPGTATPEDELRFLDSIASRQATDRNLLFRDGVFVASAKSRDLGNDAVAASTYGLRNAERAAGYLATAVPRDAESEEVFEDLYRALVEQTYTLLQYVAGDVGARDYAGLEPGTRLDLTVRPVPPDKQRRSLQFVVEHGFRVPPFLLRQDILDRLGAPRAVEIVGEWQAKLVSGLIFSAKLGPALQAESVGGYPTYPVRQLYADVTAALFPGLEDRSAAPDIFRRALQRAYVEQLIGQATGTDLYADGDIRMLARATLRALKTDLQAAARRRKAGMTADHFADLAIAVEQGLVQPADVAEQGGPGYRTP